MVMSCRRMTFPADVVITLTTFQNEFEADFRNICAGFDSIECSQFVGQVEVPLNTHLSRILMSRQHRDEFTYENNLVALRFMEHPRGSPQRRGIAGLAKVWVNSFEQLIRLLEHMQYLGGINRAIISNPNLHQPHSQHASPAKVQQATTSLMAASDGPTSRSAEGPPSSSKQQIQGQVTGTINFTPTGVAGPLTPAGAGLPMERSVIRWPHSSFRFMFLGELLKRNMNALLGRLRANLGITTTCPYRDKSDAMACLLLESNTGLINDATARVNDFMNAVLQAMTCVSVAVNQNQRKVLVAQDLLKIKEIQGRCGVHIILDPQDADIVRCTSCTDLRLPITTASVPLDEMSGIGVGLGIGLGVGVVLGVDYEDPPTLVDDGSGTMVLPAPLVGQSLPKNEDGVLRSLTYVYPLDLISAGVLSAAKNASVTVSVLNSEVPAVFGDRIMDYYPSLGQYHIVMILDPQDEKLLSSAELEKLSRGEVLVDSFDTMFSGHNTGTVSNGKVTELRTHFSSMSLTGNTLIRVRPEFIAFGPSASGVSETRVLDGLERAVSTGIRAADSKGLECCMFLAPVHNSLFSAIDSSVLISTFMEAIVGSVRTSDVMCLRQLIVCDECPVRYRRHKLSPSASSVVSAAAANAGAVDCSGDIPRKLPVCLPRAYKKELLQPYSGNQLASALLNIVDRDIDPIASVSACLSNKDSMQATDNPKMELLSLNMPIPPDLNMDAIVLATKPPFVPSIPLPPSPSRHVPLPSPPKSLLGSGHTLEYYPGAYRPQFSQPSVLFSTGSRVGPVPQLALSQNQYLLPPGIPMIPSSLPSIAMQNLLSPRIEPPTLIVVQGIPAGVLIALSYLRNAVSTV
jgi:hypothetical protein